MVMVCYSTSLHYLRGAARRQALRLGVRALVFSEDGFSLGRVCVHKWMWVHFKLWGKTLTSAGAPMSPPAMPKSEMQPVYVERMSVG